jgi:hypothetical protein
MKTVEELAREADLSPMSADSHCREDYWTATRDELSRFRDLVLEEAAKVCKSVQQKHESNLKIANQAETGEEDVQPYFEGCAIGAEDCADAIRAMKGQK